MKQSLKYACEDFGELQKAGWKTNTFIRGLNTQCFGSRILSLPLRTLKQKVASNEVACKEGF